MPATWFPLEFGLRVTGFTREVTRRAGVQRVVADPDPPRLDMGVHGPLVEERGRVDEVLVEIR